MARVFIDGSLNTEWRGAGALDYTYKVSAEYGSGAAAGEYNNEHTMRLTLPANPNPTTLNNAVKADAVAKVNGFAGSTVVSSNDCSLICGFS